MSLSDKYKSHVTANGGNGGSLYHTGFNAAPSSTASSSSNSTPSQCGKFLNDPVKLALVLGALSLGISIISTITTTTIVSDRMDAMEMYPSTYGITNVNETYYPGGYYGWFYRSSYPDLYPLADLHVSVGDRIFFTSRQKTSEDLWLVDKEVYDTCHFYNTSHMEQLAAALFLRGGYYEKNESCSTPGENGCSDRGWIMNRYLYNEEGGYTFLVQDWHVKKYGNPLYFASARDWNNWKDQKNSGCRNGVKLRVFVETRAAVPFYVDDGSSFDLSTTETVQDLMASIGHLSRMLILAQFNAEQRVRSEGDSGLTNVRGAYDGDAAYDDGTFTNGAVASIHDHSDHMRVVGIGEIQAVLNGVEFQSRHNDYNLRMPSTTSSGYHDTEDIPHPELPPPVAALEGDVDAQVQELIEWFRAWKTQNKTHRNYPPYFKPVLCYIEGTWILDDNSLDEPFESDRHAIDARTWKQLHDKIRWMANSGRKNSLEDLAHLPSSIRNLVNNTYPIVSNWEYRILCSPLKNDIPLSRFRVVNDLSVQLMGSPQTREEMLHSRRARFELNRYIDVNDPDNDHQWSAGRKKWNYLDYLMEQIPGKNNYGCNMTDELPDGSERAIHYITDRTLNACYYSRFYGLTGADAMGSTGHRRGWSDRNLFAAKTTHSKVSPIEFNFETTDEDGFIDYHRTVSRWSYAIPLEVVYMTPLSGWNPFDVPYIEKTAYDRERTGDCGSKDTAFYGYTVNNAYYTPSGMFTGLTKKGNGDTAADNVCVLGGDNEIYPAYASGHWISFPDIENGVGRIRQRYPIFPLHATGDAAFKEVKSLQAVVLPDDYDDPVANPDGFFGDDRDKIYGFEINLQGGGHQHVIYIVGWKVRNFWYDDDGNDLVGPDNFVEVEGDERENHKHTLEVYRTKSTDDEWVYTVARCRYGSLSDEDKYTEDDWMDGKCADNHDDLDR